MPRAIILAGPNGAGKTTFALEFLPNEAACPQFVNADLIAAGLSPFAPETADFAAGRAMLSRIDELVGRRADFALETTLSGNWLLNRVRSWRNLGYIVELFDLQLDAPEIGLRRIASRVQEGGHDVPESTVRRRFARSLRLLDLFKKEVDHWVVYNNSGTEPVLVAFGTHEVE